MSHILGDIPISQLHTIEFCEILDPRFWFYTVCVFGFFLRNIIRHENVKSHKCHKPAVSAWLV